MSFTRASQILQRTIPIWKILCGHLPRISKTIFVVANGSFEIDKKKPMRETKKDFNCPHVILSILIYQLGFEHTSTKADEIEKYIFH